MKDARDRKASLAVNLGLLANVLLAVAKLWAGTVGRSAALVADGINSLSDVAYNIIVKIFVKLAAKPPDREHPYGHSQLEGVGSVVVGCFIIAAGLGILSKSVTDVWGLWKGGLTAEPASAVALWVAIVTAGAKFGLAHYTLRVGRETHNPAVQAIAMDHRSDVLSASAAAIGILLGRNGLPWADPLAAGLVALAILHMGISVLRESSDSLLIGAVPESLKAELRETVTTVPGVTGIEELAIQRFGPYLIVNLTVLVDGNLTITEGDKITTTVEDRLYNQARYIRRVYVHCHPDIRSRIQCKA